MFLPGDDVVRLESAGSRSYHCCARDGVNVDTAETKAVNMETCTDLSLSHSLTFSPNRMGAYHVNNAGVTPSQQEAMSAIRGEDVNQICRAASQKSMNHCLKTQKAHIRNPCCAPSRLEQLHQGPSIANACSDRKFPQGECNKHGGLVRGRAHQGGEVSVEFTRMNCCMEDR